MPRKTSTALKTPAVVETPSPVITTQVVEPGKVSATTMALADAARSMMLDWETRLSNGYSMLELMRQGRDLAWLVWNSWGHSLNHPNALYYARMQMHVVESMQEKGLDYVTNGKRSYAHGSGLSHIDTVNTGRAHLIQRRALLEQVESAIEELQRVANVERQALKALEMAVVASEAAVVEGLATVDMQDDNLRTIKAHLESSGVLSDEQRAERFFGYDRPSQDFIKTRKHYADNRESLKAAE
jgi:hypothetical protein